MGMEIHSKGHASLGVEHTSSSAVEDQAVREAVRRPCFGEERFVLSDGRGSRGFAEIGSRCNLCDCDKAMAIGGRYMEEFCECGSKVLGRIGRQVAGIEVRV